MTAPPTSNDLTRQQLEELDALLQRMLAAPTPTPELRRAPPAVPPVVESWRIDRTDPPFPRLHLETPVDPPAPSVAFVPAEPPIPPIAPEPSLPEPQEEPIAGVPVTPSVPFQPQMVLPEPTLEPIPLRAVEPSVPDVRPAESSTIPLALRPLQAANWVAEEMLIALGCESLTRPAAKWALGIAGFAMLATAAAWVATGGRLFAMLG